MCTTLVFTDIVRRYIGTYPVIEVFFLIIVFCSLIASIGSAMIRLVDGRSISDQVTQQEWNYYSFINHYRSSRDLKIVMTPTTGDADIYVMLDGRTPNTDLFAYFSGGWGDGQDVIEIVETDPQYAPCVTQDCTIVIGIYGYTTAEYNLMIVSSKTSVQLNFGVPQLGSVGYGVFDYYTFSALTFQQQNKGIQLTINIFSGSCYIYMSPTIAFPNTTSPLTIKFDPTYHNSIFLNSTFFHGITDINEVYIGIYGRWTSTYRYFVLLFHSFRII